MSNEITVWGNTGANPNFVRLTQPSGGVVYPPGVIPGPGNGGSGGGGGPGGIGGGDGGINTPVDPTIFKPEITYPNYFDNIDVEPDADVTSSAFASSNAQTHAMSRWMIFQQSVSMEDFVTITAGSVLYDSGPTGSNLTSLPLTSTGLQPEGAYLVQVRYKGSGGGWGPWSDLMPFTMLECETPPPAELAEASFNVQPGSEGDDSKLEITLQLTSSELETMGTPYATIRIQVTDGSPGNIAVFETEGVTFNIDFSEDSINNIYNVANGTPFLTPSTQAAEIWSAIFNEGIDVRLNLSDPGTSDTFFISAIFLAPESSTDGPVELTAEGADVTFTPDPQLVDSIPSMPFGG